MSIVQKIIDYNYIKILDKIFILGIYLYALGSHSSKSAVSIGVGLVILMWWLKIIFTKGYEFQKPINYWPFLVMLSLFIISRNEISFIIESRTTSKIILGVFFFLALINELKSKKTIKKLLYITLFIVSISSLYASYQYLYEGVRRAYGLARFSITSGNVAAMGAGVALAFIFNKNNKIWQYILYISAFLINSSAVLFSLTRGSYLTWLIIVLLFFLLKFPKVFPVILIIIFLTYSYLPATMQNRFLSSFDSTESSFETRLNMWQTSIDIMRARPLRGIGLDNFPKNIPEEFDTSGFRSDHNHAHNNYFHFGAEAGIPALLLMIYTHYLILKNIFLNLWKNKNGKNESFYMAIFLGLMAFLLSGLTVVNFIDFQSNHYFWFLAGGGLAMINLDEKFNEIDQQASNSDN